MSANDIKSRGDVFAFMNNLMIALKMYCLGDFQLVRDVNKVRASTWNGPASSMGITIEPHKLGNWPEDIVTASLWHVTAKAGSLALALFTESFVAGTPFFTPCDDKYPHKGGVGYVPVYADGNEANYALLASISKFYPTWDLLFSCLMHAYAMSKGPSISLDDAEGSMTTNVSMWLSANDDAFDLLLQFLSKAFGQEHLSLAQDQMDLKLPDPTNPNLGRQLYVVISRVG